MFRLYFKLIMLALGAGLLCSPVRSAELNLLYIEYPPYYETNPDGTVGGVLVDIGRRVFERAGVKYKYSYTPTKRIMLEMLNAPIASLGWLKTTEREKSFKFSLPVYLNKPVGVLMLRENMARFAQYDSFAKLMDSNLFKIGRIDGHSEGEYLDSVLLDHGSQTVWAPIDEVQLVKMLKADRFDFILLPPEEVDALVKKAGYKMEDFVLKTMSDIPTGNARYIMYSKSIDDDLIKLIDKAIVEEIGLLIPPP
jgi:polar amino acid transport system substrate-binding protein